MRRTTSHKLSFLMYNQRANSPMEARVWTKIAKLAFNLKIKMTKRVSTVLLLQKLQKRKTGTNDVEYFCKTIKRKFARNKMRQTMMSNKIRDAKYKETKARNLFNSKYNYLVRRWGHNRAFMSQFNILLQQEIEFIWKTEKARVQSKIDFLVNKWHKNNLSKPEHRDEIQNVAVSDEKLNEKFGPPVDDLPVTFGGVQLSESEAKVLALPPKFCVFPKIEMEDVQVALQTLCCKAR